MFWFICIIFDKRIFQFSDYDGILGSRFYCTLKIEHLDEWFFPGSVHTVHSFNLFGFEKRSLIGSFDSVVLEGGFVGRTEMTEIVAQLTGSFSVNKMGGVTPTDSVKTAARLADLVTTGDKISDWVMAKVAFSDWVAAEVAFADWVMT